MIARIVEKEYNTEMQPDGPKMRFRLFRNTL